MGALSCTTPSHRWRHRKQAVLLVAAFVISSTALLRAQSSLPSAPGDTTQQNSSGTASGPTDTDSSIKPEPGLSGQTAESGPGPHSRSRLGGSNLFGLPRSFTETTSSGIKFQFALPKLSLAGLDHQSGGQGFSSPLDSGGMRSTGGSDLSLFPSNGSSMHSGAAFGGASGNPFGSASRGNQTPEGGVSVAMPLKESMFDVHLSMKDMLGGTFSQGAGGAGSTGSGAFGMAGDGGAANFGGPGGLHAPGAGGRGSPGARMSLQLKF